MPDDKKQEIEKIFRVSNSPDELFDAFRIAISNKIAEPDLYKTLLWNKALSTDEISMFAEKICKVFPEFCFNIYLWVGNIISTNLFPGENYYRALAYYQKAVSVDLGSIEPYLAIAEIYNKELNLPPINEITKIFEQGLDNVEKKSRVCFSLSNLYKKTGDKETAQKYRNLGEKFQKEGC